MVTLLAACGSQDDSSTGSATANTPSIAAKSAAAPESINTETPSDAARPVGLLISLAQNYPGGQLPPERVAQAAQDLAQNPAALQLTAEAAPEAASQTIQPQALAADYAPVQRAQNTTLYGAYFFSIYPTEITTALASNPNWTLEGPAFWASLATGSDLHPVHRFRNKTNGSYLYSIYETERADIATNYAATFEYEGIAWYARQTAAGWSTLWRFRNKTNGTYLFSAYESEKDAIVATYPDVFQLEGPAYFVRQDAQPNPVVTLSGPVRVIANTLYTYSATVANATASAWSWLWGDGSADSITNPVAKVWYKPGSYSSTLTATTPDTLATAVQAVTVAAPLDAGDNHNCALQVDATVRCWGSNNSGQLGDGSTVSRLTPTTVPNILTLVDIVTGVKVAAIAAGVYHTCALKSNGTVRCWGYNGFGQLGDGTTIDKPTPTAVPGLTQVAALGTGWYHSCALKTDGTVSCWGRNNNGQLGDATTVDKFTPTPTVVPAFIIGLTPMTGVATLATGDTHNCALKTDGTVRCWGYNGTGQLGDGSTVNKSTPTTVPDLVGVFAISAGTNHTCSLQTDSTVRCWGLNIGGQLGDGTTVNKFNPVAVPSILSLANVVAGVKVAALATGYTHSCALKTDGAVRCWGVNGVGQIGDGTTTQRLAPTAVAGGAVFWN